MATWLMVILEIIKVTVPALIVFLTVYYLFKQYLEGQRQLKMLEIRQGQQKTSLPLRLQAYERLSLFCERISLPNLILRVRKEGMSGAELKLALLLAIQQEFEYNITQQVYVSQQLWDIIKVARDDAVNFIGLVATEVGPKASGKAFSEALFQYLENRQSTGLDMALLAIKKEAAVHLQ